MSDFYYTPFQKEAQKFFEEYIPLERILEEGFDPDFSYIVEDPRPIAPSQETDPTKILVYEGLRRLTSTPVGRGALVAAYALAYLPLLEPTRTAKTYGPAELMFIQSGLGGGLIV